LKHSSLGIGPLDIAGTPGVPLVAEINGTERNRPSRATMPADEKLLVGREETTESRRAVEEILATQQLITRPNLQDEVSFLRLPKLKSMTGLSKSSLYALIRAKSFPSPVQFGPRTVAWVRSEVRQWAAERISKSRSASPHTGERDGHHDALLGDPGQRRRSTLSPLISSCP
jgi:prophage regulatory protein